MTLEQAAQSGGIILPPGQVEISARWPVLRLNRTVCGEPAVAPSPMPSLPPTTSRAYDGSGGPTRRSIDAAYRAFFGAQIGRTVQDAVARPPERHLPVGASLVNPHPPDASECDIFGRKTRCYHCEFSNGATLRW